MTQGTKLTYESTVSKQTCIHQLVAMDSVYTIPQNAAYETCATRVSCYWLRGPRYAYDDVIIRGVTSEHGSDVECHQYIAAELQCVGRHLPTVQTFVTG